MKFILLLSVLMLGMLLFWPLVLGFLMQPLRSIMDQNIWSYLVLVVPFALSVLTLSSVLKYGLGSSLRDLMLERERKDKERITAATAFIALLLFFVITAFFSPTLVKTEWPGSLTFLSLVISLVFIPMQCLAEELMFRVIPARMFFPDGFGKNRILDAVFVAGSGAFFAAMHLGNPEVTAAGNTALIIGNYFLSGAMLSLFAVLTNGFLTGLAYHTAVNLYVSVFVNTESGVIPSYSFFIDTAENFEFQGFMSTLIASVITLSIIMLYGRRKKRNG